MKKLLAISALAVLASHPLAAQEAGDAVRLPDDLRSFVAGVIGTHPRTAAAAAGISRARAEAVAAGQPLYNPELELDAAPVVGSPPDTELYTNYSAAFRLAVDISGKRALRSTIGNQQARVTEAEAHAAQMTLAADTINALVDMQSARQRLEVATKQADLAAKFLELSERRHKAGELPAMELGAAQLAAAEAASAQKEAELAAVTAEETLRITCLCEIDTAPALPSGLPAPPRLSEAQIDELSLSRPDVVAARSQVEAARQAVELARAQRIPDPSFRLGGSKEGEEKRVLIGISVPIPVLNSGSAEVAAAGRALAQAEATERQATLEAAAAIRSAMRSYQRAVQGVESWQRLGVPSLERQSDVLTRLWRSGELSATDFLVQMRDTGQANATAIDLRNTAWGAFADLLKAASRSPFIGAIKDE
jgi:cobalt-zinc-cadmium efflux system outer membrane protein